MGIFSDPIDASVTYDYDLCFGAIAQALTGKSSYGMNEARQTVCLCMIVKDEQHVLLRCLKSVHHLIDHWIIVDTGSTDGTQDLVRDYLRGIPGELIERPWKDFGHNRSEAIDLARGLADYLLTLDADEYLQAAANFCWPRLIRDAYDFLVDSGGTTYSRIQLVKSSLPWRYEGVLHEFITCDGDHSQAQMPEIRTIRLLEGARSRNPLTYRNDALILEEALQRDPGNARNTFYLAQSYRDANKPRLAMQWYERRAAMGGFAEEVWCSLYEVGRLLEVTGAAWLTVKQAYFKAYAVRPHRAEPLYRMGLYHQHRKEYDLACVLLLPAMQIPFPVTDVLFVETDVYRFLLPLEYAVACYWLGRHHEAVQVIDRLLADDCLSSERREHLLRNRQFSTDILRSR